MTTENYSLAARDSDDTEGFITDTSLGQAMPGAKLIIEQDAARDSALSTDGADVAATGRTGLRL